MAWDKKKYGDSGKTDWKKKYENGQTKFFGKKIGSITDGEFSEKRLSKDDMKKADQMRKAEMIFEDNIDRLLNVDKASEITIKNSAGSIRMKAYADEEIDIEDIHTDETFMQTTVMLSMNNAKGKNETGKNNFFAGLAKDAQQLIQGEEYKDFRNMMRNWGNEQLSSNPEFALKQANLVAAAMEQGTDKDIRLPWTPATAAAAQMALDKRYYNDMRSDNAEQAKEKYDEDSARLKQQMLTDGLDEKRFQAEYLGRIAERAEVDSDFRNRYSGFALGNIQVGHDENGRAFLHQSDGKIISDMNDILVRPVQTPEEIMSQHYSNISALLQHNGPVNSDKVTSVMNSKTGKFFADAAASMLKDDSPAYSDDNMTSYISRSAIDYSGADKFIKIAGNMAANDYQKNNQIEFSDGKQRSEFKNGEAIHSLIKNAAESVSPTLPVNDNKTMISDDISVSENISDEYSDDKIDHDAYNREFEEINRKFKEELKKNSVNFDESVQKAIFGNNVNNPYASRVQPEMYNASQSALSVPPVNTVSPQYDMPSQQYTKPVQPMKAPEYAVSEPVVSEDEKEELQTEINKQEELESEAEIAEEIKNDEMSKTSVSDSNYSIKDDIMNRKLSKMISSDKGFDFNNYKTQFEQYGGSFEAECNAIQTSGDKQQKINMMADYIDFISTSSEDDFGAFVKNALNDEMKYKESIGEDIIDKDANTLYHDYLRDYLSLDADSGQFIDSENSIDTAFDNLKMIHLNENSPVGDTARHNIMEHYASFKQTKDKIQKHYIGADMSELDIEHGIFGNDNSTSAVNRIFSDDFQTDDIAKIDAMGKNLGVSDNLSYDIIRNAADTIASARNGVYTHDEKRASQLADCINNIQQGGSEKCSKEDSICKFAQLIKEEYTNLTADEKLMMEQKHAELNNREYVPVEPEQSAETITPEDKSAEPEQSAETITPEDKPVEPEQSAETITPEDKSAEPEQSAETITPEDKPVEPEQSAETVTPEDKPVEPEQSAETITPEDKSAEPEQSAETVTPEDKPVEPEQSAETVTPETKPVEPEQSAETVTPEDKSVEPEQSDETIIPEGKSAEPEQSAEMVTSEEFGQSDMMFEDIPVQIDDDFSYSDAVIDDIPLDYIQSDVCDVDFDEIQQYVEENNVSYESESNTNTSVNTENQTDSKVDSAVQQESESKKSTSISERFKAAETIINKTATDYNYDEDYDFDTF